MITSCLSSIVRVFTRLLVFNSEGVTRLFVFNSEGVTRLFIFKSEIPSSRTCINNERSTLLQFFFTLFTIFQTLSF